MHISLLLQNHRSLFKVLLLQQKSVAQDTVKQQGNTLSVLTVLLSSKHSFDVTSIFT